MRLWLLRPVRRFSFCSGTLVQDKWVVTAAHCVEAVQDYDRYLTIYFVLGESIYSNEGIVEFDTVVDSAMHPDYRGSNSQLSADIGVLELENGIESADPIYLSELVPDQTWAGMELDYVGWGITDDGREDSGIKRTTQIPYWDSDAQFIYAYDPQTNLCSGDSGGASLATLKEEIRSGWTNGSTMNLTVDMCWLVQFCFSKRGDPVKVHQSNAIDAHIDWLREYIPPLPIPEPPPEPEDLEGDESFWTKMGCSQVTTR